MLKAEKAVCQGCDLKTLNFDEQQSLVGTIYLTEQEQQGMQVPFYVDRLREVRLPVIEYVSVEGNKSEEVGLYGIYLHLEGR